MRVQGSGAPGEQHEPGGRYAGPVQPPIQNSAVPGTSTSPASAVPGASISARRAVAGLIGGVTVLLLIVGAVAVWTWRSAGDPGASSGLSGEATTSPGTGRGVLHLAGSRTAQELFPGKLEPAEHDSYTRHQVGETSCAKVATTDASQALIEEIGCHKAYVALYVSDTEKYAVTIGYLDIGSEPKAADTTAKAYRQDFEYQSWFAFVIPEKSKITTETTGYTYVSAHQQYLTYAISAYYDGRNVTQPDHVLAGEAIAVSVALDFA